MKRNFIHEGMERLMLGLSTTSRVWPYLLQQQRMHPDKPVVVSSAQLAKLGVDRFAKMRALRSLERAGLIRVLRPNGQNPQVKLLK